MRRIFSIFFIFTLLLTSGCLVQPPQHTPAQSEFDAVERRIETMPLKHVDTFPTSLLGAELGNSIGPFLSPEDLNYYEKTSQYALENARTNTTSSWVNPATGHSGAITPIRTFKTSDNVYCRDFTQTIAIANQSRQAYNTACRNDNGIWAIH